MSKRRKIKQIEEKKEESFTFFSRSPFSFIHTLESNERVLVNKKEYENTIRYDILEIKVSTDQITRIYDAQIPYFIPEQKVDVDDPTSKEKKDITTIIINLKDEKQINSLFQHFFLYAYPVLIEKLKEKNILYERKENMIKIPYNRFNDVMKIQMELSPKKNNPLDFY
jgi:hypothetical protein